MDTPNERSSIWSVSEKWTWAYFVFFALQLTLVTLFVTYQEIVTFNGDDRITTYLEIERRVSSTILTIAARSMVLMLILEVIRMIAEKYLRRRFAEGQEEANRKWLAWLKRKEEAEKAGRDFDEPPPVEEIKSAS